MDAASFVDEERSLERLPVSPSSNGSSATLKMHVRCNASLRRGPDDSSATRVHRWLDRDDRDRPDPAFRCVSFAVLWMATARCRGPSLMNRPLVSTSLREFWGRRWNTAFRDLTHRFLFRPCASWFGPRWGILAGFLFSGAIHDLVISVPARGGYGGPTAFFAIQGAGDVDRAQRVRPPDSAWVRGWPGRLLCHRHSDRTSRVAVPSAVRRRDHRAVHAGVGSDLMDTVLARLIFAAGIGQLGVLDGVCACSLPAELARRIALPVATAPADVLGLRRLRRPVDRRVCRA